MHVIEAGLFLLALGSCSARSSLAVSEAPVAESSPSAPAELSVPPHEHIEKMRYAVGQKANAHCFSEPVACYGDLAELLYFYELKRLAFEDLAESWHAKAAENAGDSTQEQVRRSAFVRRAEDADESAQKAGRDAIGAFNAVWTLSWKLPPVEGGLVKTYNCPEAQANEGVTESSAVYLRELCVEVNENALRRIAEGAVSPECERASGLADGSRVVAQFCVDKMAGRIPDHASSCCKVCGTTSRACGDTCISLDKTCHVGPGCACQ